jgi:hypothetical protein
VAILTFQIRVLAFTNENGIVVEIPHPIHTIVAEDAFQTEACTMFIGEGCIGLGMAVKTIHIIGFKAIFFMTTITM